MKHSLSFPVPAWLGRFLALASLACIASADLCAQTNIRAGWGRVVLDDIAHQNGNVYDQVLLTGPNITVAADPGQVVRVSFLDDNEDIVQVEFSGAGTVTIELDPATYSSPSPARKYHQPGIEYVRGHATIRVRDAGPGTFVSVFSVGRGNAVNAALFPAGMSYDGMADIQLLQIEGSHFGGILTGNARYTANTGVTGIHAPGTRVRYRVVAGDISANGEAVALLRLGDGSSLEWDAGEVLIAGGQLLQANRTPLDVSSNSGGPLPRIRAVDGTLSSGQLRPTAAITAEFASRTAGSVSINNIPRPTRGFVPASFAALLQEAGFSTLDFGEGVRIQFSGGNTGTYSFSEDTIIDGESVYLEVTGGYTYTAGPSDRNHMIFSLTFSGVRISSASLSYRGTIADLARLSGEPLPVRITATADFTSSVSGTATTTLFWSTGQQESESATFDIDHPLDFQFL